jgi:valacyclovir hydrolase
MPFIEVGGIEFHYLEAGQGAPLVLLGGTLGSARGDFAPQLDTLSARWRVIAPDRRGYGKTRPPDRDFPIDFYQRDARDMAGFMTALHLEPATILGWSEGADVALCLAARYPERVTRLIVWGGIAMVEEADIAIFESRRDFTTWPAKARDAMSAIYGEVYWRDTWQRWCDVMGLLHASGGDVHLGEIEKIWCPVLILHGRKDPLIRPAHPATLHRRIPGSCLREIEEGGHYVHLTHAAEFNRCVLRFIDSATTTSAHQ